MEVFKNALNIGDDHKFGEAFDQELQEKKRIDRLAEKEQKRKEEEEAKKRKLLEDEKEKMMKEIAALK